MQAASLVELDSRLPKVVEMMVASPFRWVLIIETTTFLYVQFLATEDGVLVSECVSNEYLPAERALSEEAEELLPELGWGWPAPPNQQNWQTVEFGEDAALDSAVLAVHTLRRVFGCRDEDVLKVKFFRSSKERVPAVDEER